MPLVSIIIPVFNGEKYVSKCLQSIVSQTYNNLEIIIINDGSNDNSLKICRDFECSSRKIHIINNDNHGVGYSRNCGLEIAKGEYVLFVDCDDIIPENYVEVMIKAINSEKFDLIMCRISDLFINEDETVITKKWRPVPQNLTNDFLCDYYKLRPESVSLTGPVAKIYKKSIIKKHNISFPTDINWGEDQVFNQAYYKFVRTFAFVTDTYYCYCHRKRKSLSKTFNNKNFEERLDSVKRIVRFSNEMGVENKEMIIGDHCFNVIGSIDILTLNKDGNEYIAYKNGIKLLQEIVQNEWKGSNWQRKLTLFLFDCKIYLPLYVYLKLRKYVTLHF